MTTRGGITDNDSGVRRRILTVIALVAFAALTTVRWPIKTLGQVFRGQGGDETTRFLARVERLAPHLPATGRIGYCAQPEAAGTRKSVRAGRLELLQYALAPRIIETFFNQDLVIFDSDDPASCPTAETSRDWQLVTDLGDGIKLFRTPEHP